MKKFNILILTSAVALLTVGCVKPVQDTQSIYNETPTTPITQSVIYEDAQPIIFEGVQDNTVITTSGVIGQPITGGTTFPDPYAVGGTATVFNDPYASQEIVTDYPVATTSSSLRQGEGIHLQIAALKDYSTAADYKNRLSLAPGLLAYVQRGTINKVIISGISSVAEANRLKESRFPGAFIVHGGTSFGYTPAVQRSSTDTYNVNNPYGRSSSSSVSMNSGIGVQLAAFSNQSKAQRLVNKQSGRYSAFIKKEGGLHKVILKGFSSRSAAKSHASRVGGFVVNY